MRRHRVKVVRAAGWLLMALVAAGCHMGAPQRGVSAPASNAPLPSATPAARPTTPAEVEAAVAAQPRDYDLQMNAAQYYMLQGQNAAAIPHLQAAARLQPGLALPWIALGDARMLAGDDAGARAAYGQARRREPGNPLIDRGLGQLLIHERRLSAARSLLDRAVQQHPESVELRIALGNLDLVLNQPAAAITVLKPAAISAPGSADVHYLLGQAYERSLHIRAALTEEQAAVAADPSFVEAYGRIGIYLIDLTRYAEARPPLRQAIQLNPRESHYYWALGDSYLLDASDPANLSRAIDLYHQALRIDPRNGKALLSLALALTRRAAAGDREEAARVLEQVVRLEPANASAFYKLYETDTLLGRSTAASQALRRFRALEGRERLRTAHRYQMTSFVDTASAHLQLGRRDLAAGQAHLAATEFHLALERDPHLTAARQGLAQSQRRAGPAQARRQPPTIPN